MYAVIQTGGKQYKVQPGDMIEVEKLDGDVGAPVKFSEVLFAADSNGEASQIWLGKPLLNGATVEAEVVGQGRGEKSLIIKMKRRKGYRKTQGHRQFLTQVLVTLVDNGAGKKATLSAEDKKAKLASFVTDLTPKGEAFTKKTLGSRERARRAKMAAGSKTTAKSETAAPKTAAKKAPAKKK